MAKISNLEKGGCLVWDTERPQYTEDPRKSSNFSVKGYEWYFQMGCRCCRGKHSISLSIVTDKNPLERDFTISTFVTSECGSNWPCSVKTVTSTSQEIWSSPVTATSCEESARKWRIIFYIDAEFSLPQGESATHPNPNDKCIQASTLDILPDLESLSHDFRQLLADETFPDVQLRCGDRIIRVHRSILASRSDVFGAMFRNNMTESETGIVDVTDMDADVFDSFLKYVYSGQLPEYSDDTASSLYAAGDKYSIHALKKSCSDRMVGGLTDKNCLDFLAIADAHSDEGFKDRVVSFVAENLEALDKQAWSEFRKIHYGLTFSVYERRLASTLSKQA